MKSALLLAVLTSLVAGSFGARILAMLPFYGKSHHIFSSAVLKILIQRGHQVVEYSPTPSFQPSQNYTHFEIHSSTENEAKNWTYEEIAERINVNRYTLGLAYNLIWDITYTMCEETFHQKSVKKLMNSDEHFDLVITSSSFGQESMVAFGHKFKAPTITLQGYSLFKGVDMDAGNSLQIATIPDLGSVVTSDEMSLIERLMNFISTIITLIGYYNYHLPIQNKMVQQHFGPDMPPLTEMLSNISMYMLNIHPAVEYVRPYSPNIIPIAGISFSTDRISLPENIQNFMDGGRDGVIYFSLGTVVPAHIMPKEIFQIYVNVFKKLKQRVLWKIGKQNITGLPKNILITKWVPQPGVLAHPNCVLFMTHGGQFSLQDALYAGVPTVGTPFFGDQPNNAKLTEHRGFGMKLDFRTLSEETLHRALTTVLNNPKYMENAKRWSRIFRDRPLSAAESVIYWVEYVIRHKGAHHLRPFAAHLSWYKLALLDVMAVIFAALLALLLVTYFVSRRIFSFILENKIQIRSNKKID